MKYQYFDLDYVVSQQTISWALDQLKEGERFLFVMNVLIYTDFRKWPITQIRYCNALTS